MIFIDDMLPSTAMKLFNESIVYVTSLLLLGSLSAQAQQPAQSRIYNFECSQGKQFRATFTGDRAIIELDNRSLTMQQVRSGSGIRYQAGKYTLSSKGNQAELTFNNQPLYQGCTGTMISSTFETVSGTVTYRERIALPPNAIVRVTLEAVGTPTEVIAEQTIATQGRQVPIPFSLNYDTSNIREQTSYIVRAQILVDNQLRFIGDADYATSPKEKPAKVEVIVRSVNPNPR